jgi:GNAT superfamily N-acetyltransferase
VSKKSISRSARNTDRLIDLQADRLNALTPMSTVTIHKVTTNSDLKRFIDYPYQKYAHDPVWVPPLRMEEFDKFNPKKNPFYEHARMDLYLAEQSGKVVGRIAAIDNDIHTQLYPQDNLAFFGFFEAENQVVTDALLQTVEAWAKSLGRAHLRGPVNPSMDDGVGFQLDAFDTTPYVMMNQNPHEYPGFIEAAGYSKIKDFYAWKLTKESFSAATTRLADRIRKRLTFTIRTLNMKDYDNEVKRLVDFYNEEWEANWGQTKYTSKEALRLGQQLKLIVDPNVILFLEMDNQLVGLALGFPDANQLLHKIKGGRLIPFGIIPFLNRRKIITRLRTVMLGVRKAYRNKGLEMVLIDEYVRRGLERGYTESECSWILEDNHAINNGIEASGGWIYKRYRLYQKDI